MASKNAGDGAIDSSCDFATDETGRTRSTAKTTDVVGRDRGDHGDLVEPRCDGNPGRQTTAKRPRDFIVTSVFEGKDREPKNPVVLAPQNGGGLRWGRGDAFEAGLPVAVGRDAAARTARPGHGMKAAATRATQAAVLSGEHIVICHAQSRQQNSLKGSPHSDSHGPYPSPHQAAGQDCSADYSAMRVRADTRVEIGDERLALYSADAISLPPIAGELMPHLGLRGTVDFQRAATELDLGVIRWGRAVIKTSDAWKRSDGQALLADGVVVELGRPLHPIALVAVRDGDTVVRLWPVVEVERTPAVQHWLGAIARRLQTLGCGPVRITNIGAEILEGLELEFDLD